MSMPYLEDKVNGVFLKMSSYKISHRTVEKLTYFLSRSTEKPKVLSFAMSLFN